MDLEAVPPSPLRKIAWALLLIVSVSGAAVSVSAARQGLFAAAGAYLIVLTLFAAAPGGVMLAIVRSRSSADGAVGRIAAAAIIAVTAYLAYGISETYAVFSVRSREGSTRGRLGQIRSALSIYFGDHNGKGPRDLVELVPRYLEALPGAYTVAHGEVAGVKMIATEAFAAGRVADSGGWGYVVSGPSSGTIFVDCTHNDTRGRPWLAEGQSR